MKIFKIVALTLVMALLLGGCSLVRVDQEKVENQVVAKVNDTKIYRYEIKDSEFKQQLDIQLYLAQQNGGGLSQQEITKLVKDYRETTLKNHVKVEVMLQKAVELGITLTEEEKSENLKKAQEYLDNLKNYVISEVEQEFAQAEAAEDETIVPPAEGASDETADNTDDAVDDTADDSQEATDDTEDNAADDTADTETTGDDAADTTDDTTADTTDDTEDTSDDAVDTTDDTADDTQEPEQTEKPTDPKVLAEAENRYNAFIEENDITLERLQEDYNNESILAKVRDYCIEFAEVTDEDVRTWYDQTVAKQQEEMNAEPGIFEQLIRENKIYAYVPEGIVAVRDVVISFDDTLSAELKTAYAAEDKSQYDTLLGAALTEHADFVSTAADVGTRLAGGEEIADVVEELSADMDNISETSSPDGYVIDPRTKSYSGAFVDAATALKNVGDVSEPFTDYDGVHVLQLVKVYEPGVIAFDELKDNIKKALQPGAEEDKFVEMLDQWVEEADVKYYFNRLHSHRD